jgi:hypothetical protein
MAAVYDFICRKCGVETTRDAPPKDGVTMRHIVKGKVCGTFRRDWSSIHMNRVPGGGRG